MGAGLARAGETPEAVGDRGQCPQMAEPSPGFRPGEGGSGQTL